MKTKQAIKFFLIIIATGLIFSCKSANDTAEKYIDITSADSFFLMADKLVAGIEPDESEWKELFLTHGYRKTIQATFPEKGDFIRNAMNLAYHPGKIAERDSVLAIPVTEILSEWESLLLRVMLDNFIDMKNNQSAIKEQLHALDGGKLLAKAEERLKNFLVNPVDSLVSPIPVSIICMEPDALSHLEIIVWDANLFYKQSEEDRVNLLAHEMFHTYRRHFTDENNTNGLLRLFHAWQNEGIADQIDKKTLSDLSSVFTSFGLPDSYVDEYNDIYNNTPQTMREVENLTLSFLHGDIEEEQYNSSLGNFIQFGGHPNAFYLSTIIKNAGYEKEMIETFASPVDFVKLYNKSVGPDEAFGSEFMEYLESFEF